jgi:hypothetical protein
VQRECPSGAGSEAGQGVSGWFKSADLVSLREGLEWVLRSNTLSPHFVSTLCRLRFVFTLCPYALSKAKETTKDKMTNLKSADICEHLRLIQNYSWRPWRLGGMITMRRAETPVIQQGGIIQATAQL